jgi:Fur family ferric uptake transcriptional regulator
MVPNMQKHAGLAQTRTTRQRQVILEELRQVTCHPTADAIYQRVQARIPRISLGTVYRNLDLLSAQGQIQRLEIAGSQMRFDGNAAPHPHIRCLECGAVADVPCHFDVLLTDAVQAATDFAVLGQIIEFTGICPACQPETCLRQEA